MLLARAILVLLSGQALGVSVVRTEFAMAVEDQGEISADVSTAQNILAEVEEMAQNTQKIDKPKIETIQELTQQLENALMGTHKDAEAQVGSNLAAIKKCNDDKAATFSDISATTKTKVEEFRKTHAACREQEMETHADMVKKCRALKNWLKSLESPEKTGSDDAAKVEWVGKMDSYWCPKGAMAKEKSQTCKKAKSASAAAKEKCDPLQSQFELGFCTWRVKLIDACDAHTTCYNNALQAYKNHKVDTKKLIAQWKTEYVALKKISCYVKVWLSDNDATAVDADHWSAPEGAKTVDAEQLEECKALHPDTSAMEIDFKKPVDKAVCSLAEVAKYPGTKEFKAGEYAKFLDVKEKIGDEKLYHFINEPTACEDTEEIVETTTAAPVTEQETTEVITTTKEITTTTTQEATTTTVNVNEDVTIEDVCIHARGNKMFTVNLPRDIAPGTITFTHRSGRVSCRRAESGRSNFGCDGDSIAVVMTKHGDKNVLLPRDDMNGITKMGHGHAWWYKAAGTTKDSKTLTWNVDGEVHLTSGEYDIWYNEDLTGGTEGDNWGQACYDMTIRPRQVQVVKDVCIHSAGDKYFTVDIPSAVTPKLITFTHKKGRVSCRRQSSGLSNFGCDGDSIAIVMTKDGDKNVILPRADMEGITKMPHGHAWWYKAAGTTKDSEALTWKADGKVHLTPGKYNIWYNEDLTGGTEGDNWGSACYDMNIVPKAELIVNDVCIHSRGDKFFTVDIPSDMTPKAITFTHKSGKVSCASSKTAASNFGCGNDMVAIVMTKHGDKKVILPRDDMEGISKTSHGHAFWYKAAGTTKDSEALTWKADGKVHLAPGKYDIWYNEDLTGGTEGDNWGSACYDMNIEP